MIDPSVANVVARYSKYEPDAFYFEVVHLTFKVFFAGALLFLGRGSNAQLAIGLLALVLYSFISSQVNPYVWDSEDFLWCVPTSGTPLPHSRRCSATLRFSRVALQCNSALDAQCNQSALPKDQRSVDI